MRGGKDWDVAWQGFFGNRTLLAGLREVLGVNGCREGWLQAEAFRYFRGRGVDFFCNERSIGRRVKADFSAYADEQNLASLTMFAECKVLGLDYQPKNVTGTASGLQALLAAHPGKGTILLNNDMPSRAFHAKGTSSLVSDYFRLVEAVSVPLTARRYLFLVLDKRHKPNHAGGALLRLRFEAPPVISVKADDLEVRGWRVRGRLA